MMTAKEEILCFLRMPTATARVVSIAGDLARTLIGVKSPYHQGYIEDLKTNVPHQDREWDPANRLWWISAGYYNTIIKILVKHYPLPIQSYNHVEDFCRLAPKSQPRPKQHNKNLNKSLINAVDEITKDGNLVDVDECNMDVIEIIMDTWKDGLLNSETTLETIYNFIKN